MKGRIRPLVMRSDAGPGRKPDEGGHRFDVSTELDLRPLTEVRCIVCWREVDGGVELTATNLPVDRVLSNIAHGARRVAAYTRGGGTMPDAACIAY